MRHVRGIFSVRPVPLLQAAGVQVPAEIGPIGVIFPEHFLVCPAFAVRPLECCRCDQGNEDFIGILAVALETEGIFYHSGQLVPIGVVCDTRIDAAAPLHLAEAYPGLGVAPQVDAACGVSDGMLAASHRIAAGHAGVLSAYVVVAHAGVVGLMARYALDLVNQPKGRLGRTALSAGYSFLLWGYPMEG